MLTVVTSKENIDICKSKGVESFIFGLDGLSSGYDNNIKLEEIEKIVLNNPRVEIFIAVNKNIFNDELDYLEKCLNKLNDINIKGVLFYDLSVLRLYIKNHYKFDLVWNQTFMVTNYNTCNYYYEKGVKYGFISKEITLDEINEICLNTKMEMFSFVFGYPNMSYSRRTLLSNYYKSMDKKKEKNVLKVTNNNEDYFVKDEDDGCIFYYGKILNYASVLNDIKAKYLVLNDSLIDKDIFIKIVELYRKIIDTKDLKYVKETEKLVGNYVGFLNTKTIYKVKKNG